MEVSSALTLKKKERIAFLDIARGIAILLVVAGHLIQKDTSVLNHGESILSFIYSFHMPVFFVLSGMGLYLSLGREQMSFDFFKSKLKKYIKRLLLCYFLWSLISFLIFTIRGQLDNYEWLCAILTFRGRAPVWFLGALFWGEVAFLLVHFVSKNRIIGSLITAILSGVATVICNSLATKAYEKDSIPLKYTFVSVARFFPVLFFICIGFLAMFIIRKYKIPSFIYLIAGIIFATALSVIQIKSGNSVNVHTFEIGNPYIFLLTSVFGSLALVCICKAVSGLISFRLLSALGINSLGIMLIHYDPFKTMEHSWNICSALPTMPKCCTFLIALAITTGISYFFTAMINKKLLLQ